MGAESPGEPRVRLAPLTEPELDPAQRELWQSIAAGPRGARAVRPEGFLTGPFDVLLRSPRLGAAVAELGGLLRFESDLSQRHRELAIVIVTSRWRAGFAWLRHDEYAAEAGIPADAVAAIAEDRTPSFPDEADRVVYELVHELVHTGAVGDAAYDAALALLGEAPLVELVSLTGYYCLTSFILNAFAVPLPAGARTPWDPR